jgi:hypothetical protein
LWRRSSTVLPVFSFRPGWGVLHLAVEINFLKKGRQLLFGCLHRSYVYILQNYRTAIALKTYHYGFAAIYNSTICKIAPRPPQPAYTRPLIKHSYALTTCIKCFIVIRNVRSIIAFPELFSFRSGVNYLSKSFMQYCCLSFAPQTLRFIQCTVQYSYRF